MRVLLSTYDSRGGVEPYVALAAQLQALGAEVQVCAPPDCADRLAQVGVPLVPIGAPVRQLVHATTPPSVSDVPRIAAALMAEQFEKLAPIAERCDAIVTSGVVPAVVGARSIAEKLGIFCVPVSYCPIYLPSPHHRPQPLPGRPIPPDVTDQRVLNEIAVRNYNALFGEALNERRASIGLAAVNDVRAYFVSDHPWLAADPALAPWKTPAELEVVQTGAWITQDERPLSRELQTFLDAGTPPVYVSFGSMRSPMDFARTAIDAIRAQGRRAIIGRGWADLDLIDDGDDCFALGEVNQQALFKRVAGVVHHGGAGTTTVSARAGAPQIVVPQIGDQPYWASRVVELGIGAAHDGPIPTVESLSLTLSAALTSEIRARAIDVAGTIRTDGAAVAAKLLFDAVGQPATTTRLAPATPRSQDGEAGRVK